MIVQQPEVEDKAQDFHPVDESKPTPLFAHDEYENMRQRWADVQTKFVDDPRGSVKEADDLVSATMRRLSEIFTDERKRVEQVWDKQDQVSTEDLRVAFRRYRSFFDRLLSV